MDKRFLTFFACLLLLASQASSQILTKVHWTSEISRTDVKVGDEVEIVFKATIDPGWYIYTVDFDPDCGPIPMTVTYETENGFERKGELRAINDVAKHDKTFDCDVRIFQNTGIFRQTIKILSDEAATVSGAFEGQVCSEAEGLCVLFEDDFSFSLNVSGAPSPPLDELPAKSESREITPEDESAAVTEAPSADSASVTIPQPQTGGRNTGPVLDTSILEGEASYGTDSFGALLLIAFLAGFASLITPCVFPMVPMTVTFFLRDNQTKAQGIKKAIIFGLSVIAIYTTAGTLFAVLLGTDGLNALATHWAPNLFVFAIFILFALSFFGLFEINAPHQLVNKADSQVEKGGLAGIFFLAATLVLVSFSCTVPIVGSVLFLSAGGEILKPITVMFFYSLAFSLPFTFFAMFPELIKSLPKSGGWLNSVKVSLGFLELALALKFFSIADQAYHWGILDREINIALWIVIFSMLGVYLLGKLRLPGDTPLEKVSISRLMLSIFIFSFVVYLVPGLWGAPLKALAGYLPPMHTHDFNLAQRVGSAGADPACEDPKYADFLHLPHGLTGYFDYDQAIKCARELDKPLFIDFTGHGCTNCREMEAVVWSDPQVLNRLRNDFVVVALYVDDKTQLPESEWYVSKHDGKSKKTIGKRNADLQITNLDNNAQPFYVLVGKDERVLAWPYAYDRSVSNFVDFLDSGKRKFQELY
ncbi:MAG TPA: cytochrome c biogenesis protein CcdA [Cyclobacteriaceae bacterium]|nr:cytochrome c biogenesis protein CcdA [Cyclobacteriaceae bacterium]